MTKKVDKKKRISLCSTGASIHSDSERAQYAKTNPCKDLED